MRGLPYAMPPWMEPHDETLGDEGVVADGYGMGCMLLRRDALVATEFRAPEYWVGLATPGEDWQWSLDSGLPVSCHTGLSCWHCCEDGTASRIEFGELVDLTVWMGEGEVETIHGSWKPNQTRKNIVAEEQALLQHGFVCGTAREMALEWKTIEEILGR